MSLVLFLSSYIYLHQLADGFSVLHRLMILFITIPQKERRLWSTSWHSELWKHTETLESVFDSYNTNKISETCSIYCLVYNFWRFCNFFKSQHCHLLVRWLIMLLVYRCVEEFTFMWLHTTMLRSVCTKDWCSDACGDYTDSIQSNDSILTRSCLSTSSTVLELLAHHCKEITHRENKSLILLYSPFFMIGNIMV